MRNIASLRNVIALAAIASGGGLESLAQSPPRDWCVRCQQRGKSTVLVRSVTGARYCHRCGYFESKDKP